MDDAESLVNTEAASTSSNELDSHTLKNLFSHSESEQIYDQGTSPLRPISIKRSRAARRQAMAQEAFAEVSGAELQQDAPVEQTTGSTVDAVHSIEVTADDVEHPEDIDFDHEDAVIFHSHEEDHDTVVGSVVEPAEDTVDCLVQSDSQSEMEPNIETTIAPKIQTQQPIESAVERASFRSLNTVPPDSAMQPTAKTPSGLEETKVSRNDLVNVLESFVNLIKNTGDPPAAPMSREVVAPTQIRFEPNQNAQTVQADDKTAEVEELRCLLVEAQETIIRLLTDRVEDRARMAQLETELRLIPDLQAQADRTIAVAMNTDDFRRDLTKVKYELERVRLAKVRTEIDRSKRSWWRGVRGWFFKTNEIIVNEPAKNQPEQDKS